MGGVDNMSKKTEEFIVESHIQTFWNGDKRDKRVVTHIYKVTKELVKSLFTPITLEEQKDGDHQ